MLRSKVLRSASRVVWQAGAGRGTKCDGGGRPSRSSARDGAREGSGMLQLGLAADKTAAADAGASVGKCDLLQAWQAGRMRRAQAARRRRNGMELLQLAASTTAAADAKVTEPLEPRSRSPSLSLAGKKDHHLKLSFESPALLDLLATTFFC